MGLSKTPRSAHLPHTLGVPAQRLLEEADEYFDAGARVRPGDTVFDVGANVGAFALRAAQHAQGDIKLYCFEPSPFSFQALTENCRGNALLASARPQLLRGALAAPEQSGRECTFYHFANFPTDSTLHIEAKREEFEQFFQAQGDRLELRVRARIPGPAGSALGRCVGAFVANLPKGTIGRWGTDRVTGLRRTRCSLETLETIVLQHAVERIDLLKIDVEGAEVDVLRGAAGVLARVGSIVIETSARGGRSEAVMETLRRHGFKIVRTLRPRRPADAGLDNLLVYAVR